MSEAVRAAVVGAGSWGTALAALLTRKGHEVTLWSFEDDVVRSVRRHRVNPYLDGVTLPDGLRCTADLAAAVKDAALVVSVSPSQFVGRVMRSAAPHMAPDALVVSASKGIELDTLRRMDEVLGEVLPPSTMERFCVLSGPSFAAEVARGAPTAVVVAGRDGEAALRAQALF
ncbi:MAG TPA: 2-dehydropantoate 2-reductase N-terminal domain-containing protein, partial [Longimicrobiales bacterium]|nr:2-dehydropantoate 2-reductase N-terminal domain-containing protein [Longimicrobiales bacterium]